MANVLDAFEKSELLLELSKNEVNPFQLDKLSSFPNGMLIRPPSMRPYHAVKRYGGTVIWSLDRKGYLVNKAYIKCTLTSAGDQTAKQPFTGINIFKSFTLRTVNGHRELQTLSKEYIEN